MLEDMLRHVYIVLEDMFMMCLKSCYSNLDNMNIGFQKNILILFKDMQSQCLKTYLCNV